jgi:hypothetical protein
MRGRPRPAWLAIACLVVGIGLLVPFEQTLPVALGIAFLLAFVVLGTAAIARPEYLAGEPEREADDRS